MLNDNVRLPKSIEHAIDREVAGVSGKALARAAEALSLRYRDRERGGERQGGRSGATLAAPLTLTEIERLAYAIVRAPATYAAVASVLSELRQRAPALRLTSVVDLGAGPGAATWAVLADRDADELERVTLIEQDRGFIDLGRRILGEIAPAMAASARWECADLRTRRELPTEPEPARDLVIISYALGELDAAAATALIERAWSATGQALIVIEPGTPRHFAGVLAARDWLIRAGACIIAPCPHAVTCPMAGTSDWCHMAARVERTSLHRRVKGGDLPYEDEKFSYVIALRQHDHARPAARIVRRPEEASGRVTLTLCTPAGLTTETVLRGRGAGDAFRRARKSAWGDAWDVSKDA
jgi:ribosomal protein RSM22 (predicted rRNA methylase)